MPTYRVLARLLHHEVDEHAQNSLGPPLSIPLFRSRALEAHNLAACPKPRDALPRGSHLRRNGVFWPGFR